MWNWFKNLFFPKVHVRIGVVAPVKPIVQKAPAKKPVGAKKPAAKKPTSIKKGTTVPKKGTAKKVVKKG